MNGGEYRQLYCRVKCNSLKHIFMWPHYKYEHFKVCSNKLCVCVCVSVASCMRSSVSPSVCGSANWPSSIAQATVILLWWRRSGWTLLRVNWWLVLQSVPMIWWQCLWARWRPSDRSTLAHHAASLFVSTMILVNAGVTLLLCMRFLQENHCL